MNSTEWARSQGVHPQTAYRWFRNGTLPVPAVRVNERTVLVSPDAAGGAHRDTFGRYARVSSHDQLTAGSSSRWAGAITRSTEDSYGLARRNLQAERDSLRARVKTITARVKVSPGDKKGCRSGYASAGERWEKQRRAQVLAARLGDVEAQLATGAAL